MTGHLAEVDVVRLARGGIGVVSPAEGLALYDAAVAGADPFVAATRLDLAALTDAPVVLRRLAGPARRAPATPATQRQSWGAMDATQRRARLLDLVLAEAAVVLGRREAGSIQADTSFRDLGFDSLISVELRNRLNVATGQRLATTVVFDHRTPSALASHLNDQFGKPTGVGAEPSTRSVVDEFRNACRSVDGDVLSVARTVSRRRRPTGDRVPEPVRLSTGSAEPVILCFPSLLAPGNPLQYQKLSRAFESRRDVWVLPNPGYGVGERTPTDLNSVVTLQSQAALRQAAGAPFVLLGHSSGGWIANEVARRLEATGLRPSGVVLIDTVPTGAQSLAAFSSVARTVWSQTGLDELLDDGNLCAMGAYLDMFADLQPSEIDTPTLFIDAEQRMQCLEGVRESWTLPCQRVRSPGDHFSMMGSHSSQVANAVEHWLCAT